MNTDKRDYNPGMFFMARFLSFFWLTLVLTAADYDLIIRNARVVDGTGNPWYRGDVGVAGGRIVAVGDLSRAHAARTLDAKERIVAPGFIDVHTHVEDSVAKVPGGDNYVMDGVTTI